MSADTLRRAHAVHPVTAVQVEYSPFCLAIEEPQIAVLETCRELGIAVVAYSPLGNGLITGTIRKPSDWNQPGDLRKALPWLSEAVFGNNLQVIDKISKLAEETGITAAQLSLAWVLAQGDDVFAIPGTRSIARLRENLASLEVELSIDAEQSVREIAKDISPRNCRVQELTGYAFGDTPQLNEA